MPRQLRRRIPVARPDSIARSPGSLRAPAGAQPSHLAVMAWGPEVLTDRPTATIEEIAALRSTHPVVWVNVAGLADIELLRRLGDEFGLHELALEDTLNVAQRPKVDRFDEHDYIVARMPVSQERLATEQISIFLGSGFLVTVQEVDGDYFDGVRKRIRDGRPRLRNGGADYLAYALIDALIDSYFPLIESLVRTIDEIELTVISKPDKENATLLHDIKRDLITLQRYLEPTYELINVLMREDGQILAQSTQVFMRDCLDHCKHALDLVNNYRDHSSAVMDLHLSAMSQQMNEVMKVLTVIATVFIPLSFISGLYGMNFDTVSRWNMPELSWAFGYPYALTLMGICASGLLVYIWKKGWFR